MCGLKTSDPSPQPVLVVAHRLGVAGFAERVAQPFETFVETVTRSSAGGLNVPGPLSETVQTKLVGDFSRVHGIWKILFVGKNQEQGIAQLILVEHSLELLTCLNNTISVIRVDHEDDTLGILEVMPPQRSDLVLPTNVPHCELDVLVLDSLDVEADSGNRGDNLTKLELVQNGGFSGSVKTDHQNSHLFLSPQSIKQLRECETHVCVWRELLGIEEVLSKAVDAAERHYSCQMSRQ